MPTIRVRNVPESTLAALRARAERHGRSMREEVLTILQTAAVASLPRPAPGPIQLVTAHTGVRSTWPREETYGDEGR